MANPANANQLVSRGGGRTATGAPLGTSGALRRRPGRVGGSGKQQAAANYYTDDTPGLKISPVVVIGMSIGFIIFVTALHIYGKIRGA
jgi:protein transport protein SEC61 subunit beta